MVYLYCVCFVGDVNDVVVFNDCDCEGVCIGVIDVGGCICIGSCVGWIDKWIRVSVVKIICFFLGEVQVIVFFSRVQGDWYFIGIDCLSVNRCKVFWIEYGNCYILLNCIIFYV